jgi:hypothetical protein
LKDLRIADPDLTVFAEPVVPPAPEGTRGSSAFAEDGGRRQGDPSLSLLRAPGHDPPR